MSVTIISVHSKICRTLKGCLSWRDMVGSPKLEMSKGITYRKPQEWQLERIGPLAIWVCLKIGCPIPSTGSSSFLKMPFWMSSPAFLDAPNNHIISSWLILVLPYRVVSPMKYPIKSPHMSCQSSSNPHEISHSISILLVDHIRTGP